MHNKIIHLTTYKKLQAYSSISEGLFAELTYDVPYVSEITGYSIAGYGDLKGNVDATVKFFIHELDKDLSLTSVDIIPYNGKKVTTKDINVVSDDAVKSQNTDTTDSNSSNDANNTNSNNSTDTNSTNSTTTDANNTNSTNSANATTDATNGAGTGDIQTTNNTNTAVSNMEETDEVKLLNKTLESMNASWTISGVVCDIAWGEKIKS